MQKRRRKNTHTCGRKSYGIPRKEMAKALGHTPDRLTFYDATHKRKDGTYVDQSTKHCMNATFSLQAERSLNSSASTNEIAEQVFEEIFGKEHNGRVHGLGLGLTPTSYFGSASYDVGRRWNSSSQSHDSASLKAELKDLSTRHEELCGKYEDLASKHEIVSNKYAVMDAFLSQKFPGEWMPSSQETDNRVSDSSIRGRSTSFYNASTNNSSNSLHDIYFS